MCANLPSQVRRHVAGKVPASTATWFGEEVFMPPLNDGRPWTALDDYWLTRWAPITPTGIIAMRLGRTEFAVFTRASFLGVSLKPVNQSPYNRRGM